MGDPKNGGGGGDDFFWEGCTIKLHKMWRDTQNGGGQNNFKKMCVLCTFIKNYLEYKISKIIRS